MKIAIAMLSLTFSIPALAATPKKVPCQDQVIANVEQMAKHAWPAGIEKSELIATEDDGPTSSPNQRNYHMWIGVSLKNTSRVYDYEIGVYAGKDGSCDIFHSHSNMY